MLKQFSIGDGYMPRTYVDRQYVRGRLLCYFLCFRLEKNPKFNEGGRKKN